MTSLQIALATCNGARYLPELLQSLFAQTCQDFEIVVADDNSNDQTLAVLADFQTRYPGRIRIVGFAERSGGAAANFERLSNHLSADYIAYCDQDDVWLPHKVASSLDRVHAVEVRYGRDFPILVHTDLKLVDAELKLLHPSFWRYMSINPERRTLQKLLIEMSVTGCAVMINRALLQLALPIPPEATMHDHWFSLVAAAFGQIEFIAEPSILYRQHGHNASRRPQRGARAFVRRAAEVLSKSTAQRDHEEFNQMARQAAVFASRYGAALDADQRRVLDVLANIQSRKRLSKCVSLLRTGILRTSLMRNLALFHLLLST